MLLDSFVVVVSVVVVVVVVVGSAAMMSAPRDENRNKTSLATRTENDRTLCVTRRLSEVTFWWFGGQFVNSFDLAAAWKAATETPKRCAICVIDPVG